MRKRLWLQFHLWTLGLVALLTIANVASALRPYSPLQKESTVTPAMFIGQNTLQVSGRAPASNSDQDQPALNARLALKTARIGCEPASRLKVVHAVRQLRLQFDNCAAKDAIVGIQNRTNGFEATVFGSASAVSEPVAGTFSTPEAAKAAAIAAKKDRTIAAEKAVAQDQISTDYISLAPGENEITIRRSGREQVLKIERK